MAGDRNVRECFEDLVGDLDYPMFIVTTRGASGELAGCLIGFATQVSMDPARFMVCLSNKNRTHRVVGERPLLAVHFVPADADDLAELFGGETGDEVDKFAQVGWEEGPGGVPVLTGCENRFVGETVLRIDLGDHTGFVLEPVEVHYGTPQSEFTFHRAQRIEPGHDA